MAYQSIVSKLTRMAYGMLRPGTLIRIEDVVRLDISHLEDRVLLSASPSAIQYDGLDALDGDGLAESAFLFNGFVSPEESGVDTLSSTSQSDTNTEPDRRQSRSRELIIIDSSVEDAATLIEQFASDSKYVEYEVVQLDSDSDGVRAVEDALATQSTLIDSLHVFAHGAEGQIKLGGTWLANHNIESFSQRLSSWGQQLASGSDILFYGCNVAANDSGVDFLSRISELTGADVAASDNLTGHESLGGDWNLEIQVGQIESALPKSFAQEANWGHLLAAVGVTTTSDVSDGDVTSVSALLADPGPDGEVSLREAIEAADTDSTLDDITFNIPGVGTQTIMLTSGLPPISNPVNIDGATQPGYVDQPIIELNGNGLARDGLQISGTGTSVRGLAFFGFDGNAIQLSGTGGNHSVVGNFLGLDAAVNPIGNTASGLDIGPNSSGNVIGGTDPLDANSIGGNGDDGIIIRSDNNVVWGNFIGADPTRGFLFSNSDSGIRIEGLNNVVGGIGAGQANTISYNGGDGIDSMPTDSGNILRGNQIYSNGELGIDLNDDGITGLSPFDGYQDPPVILSASTDGSTLTITYLALDFSAPDLDFDLYISFLSDPLGFGEGQFYQATDLSVDTLSLNTLVPPTAAPAGAWVSGTVTDNAVLGHTSEFSNAVTIAGPHPIIDLDGDDSSVYGLNYSTSFTEDAGPVLTVDNDAVVSDADSNLVEILIELVNRPDGSDEILTADPTGTSITVTPYNPATGILRLSGPDTPANYEQVLKTVTYNNTSDEPDVTNRRISYEAFDGTFNGLIPSTYIQVNSANDAPVVTTSSGDAFYNLSDSTISVDSSVAASDVDDTFLESAMVRFASGFVSGEDVLRVVSPGTLTVNFDPVAGELTLTGTATVAEYEAALRSLEYMNVAAPTVTAGTRTLEFTVFDGEANSLAATKDIVFGAQLNGTVWEDVNGDGRIFDDGVAADAVSVLLYSDDGDLIIDSGDSLVATTTTDGAGNYSFDVVSGDYWVVVDSRTVESFTGSGIQGNTWAEQTYGGAGVIFDDGTGSETVRIVPGAAFGGRRGAMSDDVSTITTAEHVAEASVLSAEIEDELDFGFSFNVVTNHLGGDAADFDPVFGRTVQGSVRQFIQNANEISLANTMRFVPVTTPNSTSGADDWWTLSVTEPLPAITGASTSVDGRAFDLSNGAVIRNTSQQLLGYSGPVGLGADFKFGTGDESLVASSDAPELEIVNDRSVQIVDVGLDIQGDAVLVNGIGLYGFGNVADVTSGNIRVGLDPTSNWSDIVISNNVLGTSLGSVSDPGINNRTATSHITVNGADDGEIINNLVVYAGHSGMILDDADQWVLRGNDVRFNAIDDQRHDGIDVRASTGVLVQQNLVANNQGSGLDMFTSQGSALILDNTILGNGFVGVEESGIRLFGTGSLIQGNRIENNVGAGVLVLGETTDSTSTVIPGSPSTQNRISRNSFFANGQAGLTPGVAIDLLAPAVELTGDGISVNDGVTLANSGNIGLDYPESVSALLSGTLTQLTGTTGSNFTVEVYRAAADLDGSDTIAAGNFGEGVEYLQTATADAAGNFIATISGLISGEELTLLAIDSFGNTSEFSLNASVNTQPTANDDGYTLDEGTTTMPSSATGTLANDSDAEDTLTASLVSGVTNGTLTLNSDGSFTYTHDGSETLSDSFVYEASDGNGGFDTATVFLTITPVNDRPIASGDSYTLDEGATISVAPLGLLANDTDDDGDMLTTSELSGPTNGTLVINSDGSFTYTHNGSETFGDSFVYEVSDGNGGFDSATVTLIIMPVNDAPIAIDDAYSTDDNTTLTIALPGVLSNDTDAEGDSLTANLATGPSNGTLILNSDGSFVYVPDLNFYGQDSFQYVANDGTATSVAGEVIIDVVLVNTAPSGQNDQYTTQVNSVIMSAAPGVISNDTDPDGDALTATLVTGPASGALTLNADGSFTYVPVSGFVGSDSFTYMLNDGFVNSSPTTAIIVVNPITPPGGGSGGGNASGGSGSAPPDPTANLVPPPVQSSQDEGSDDDTPDARILELDDPPDVAPLQMLPVQLDVEPRRTESFARTSYAGDAFVQWVAPIPTSHTLAFDTYEPADVALTDLLWDDLDAMSEDLHDGVHLNFIVDTAVTMASSLTAGYVLWLIRGGAMLTTLMAQLPAWTSIDPLPIIDYIEDEVEKRNDDESLESIILAAHQQMSRG